MRIIGGTLGGRQFAAPRGHKTHPMSDKIRGALFNMLGDITGLTVLDAFAGSGALAFEAISRGASNATAIDVDKKAYLAMVTNIKSLGIGDKVKITRANVSGWSDNNPQTTFDIILLDPPYDAPRRMALIKLADHAKPGGIVVLSLPPGSKPDLLKSNFYHLTSKSYGDAELAFYKRRNI
jgi:16S rRNA (guanine966-N2)-methyltransferase